MCGIAGFFDRHRQFRDVAMISRMNDVQKYRGPDDTGIYAVHTKENRLGEVLQETMPMSCADGFLAFQRLSILDPSYRGHQPMADASGQVALTCNGEIYNAMVYRQELEADGYCFHSRTDTEVLLAMYLKYGVRKMAEKLDGMYAIAVVDMREGCLYLIRDCYGIKPLYYCAMPESFVYASEIKAFLEFDTFCAKMDRAAYQECAVFGYSHGRTMLEGVFALEPGSILRYDWSGEMTQIQYFDIDGYHHPKHAKQSHRQIQKELSHLLDQAVYRQLQSDVELGCQLSGGVDSSMTCYFATKHQKAQMDGISVIYGEQYREYSEETYMDHVAELLQMDVHKVELTEAFFVQNLPRVIWQLDTIPKFYNEAGILALAQEARRHVTVLLSGEGADELFCGYDWMLHFDQVAAGEKYGAFVCKLLERIGGYAHYFKGRTHSFQNYILYAADALPVSICRKLLCGYDEEAVTEKRRHTLDRLTGSAFDRQTKYEMQVRLPALFNRQDKMTMAASVENRVPFLDQDLVQFAFSLPHREMVRRRQGKRVGKACMKQLCADIFGADFAYRAKSGFPVPVMAFLHAAHCRTAILTTLFPNMKKRGVLCAEYVEMLYHKGEQCSYWETYAMFMAICLEIWAEIFIDRIPYDQIWGKDGA